MIHTESILPLPGKTTDDICRILLYYGVFPQRKLGEYLQKKMIL